MLVARTTLTLLTLAGVAWSRLYGHDKYGDKVAISPSPGLDELEEDAFGGLLHRLGLSPDRIRLDQVGDLAELLVLPESFFSDHLTLEQTIEIVLNPALAAMQLPDSRFATAAAKSYGLVEMEKSAFTEAEKRSRLAFLRSAHQSVGRKLHSFRQAFRRITPVTVPDPVRQDAIVEAIQPAAYPHMSPLLALASAKFQATYKGIGRLLGVSLRALRFATRWAIPAVFMTIRTVYRLIRHGRDAFSISDALMWMVERLPALDPAIGDRIIALVDDLNEVMEGVVIQQTRTRKALAKFSTKTLQRF